MLPPSSYYSIHYHILQYNRTRYLTKKYRLYAACRHFSYFGTVKDPDTSNIFIYNIQKMLKYQHFPLLRGNSLPPRRTRPNGIGRLGTQMLCASSGGRRKYFLLFYHIRASLTRTGPSVVNAKSCPLCLIAADLVSLI